MRMFRAALIIAVFASNMAGAVEVLFERETSGGYVPPSMAGWGEKVIVFKNGNVEVMKRSNHSSPWKTTKIGTLDCEVMQKLKMAVASMSAGEIEFDDSPSCTDRPVTIYNAVKDDNEIITFASKVACRTGYLSNFSSGYALQMMLDGLAATLHVNAE